MSVSLLHFDQVPSFQRKNPYIRNGYRSKLSHYLCLQSLFWWTNETLNIWTHVSGFGFFILVQLYDVIFNLRHMDITTHDMVILALTALSFQFCLICSAAYHTFCCHSEDAYNRWLLVDILGVSVSLTFIFVSGIHFAFHCFPAWNGFYIVSVLGLFATVLFMMIHPSYRSDEYFGIRLALLISWALYGFIPVLHWIYLKGGITSFVVRMMLPRIVVMYLIGGLALLIYVTKYPEKLWPGKVDFIGSSHQWWHLLVVLAFYWWYNTGIMYSAFIKLDKC